MPTNSLIHSLYGNRSPDSVMFLVDGQTLRAAEVRRHIGQYAALLRGLGVVPGDRVSFKLFKSIDVVFFAHACLQIGAILHPLNPDYTEEETEYLLRDIQPTLIVCEEVFLSHVGAQFGRAITVITLDGVQGLKSKARLLEPDLSIQPVHRDSVAAILYTSGTTGRPKGAQITHGNLMHSAQALVSVWQITPQDRMLHFLPVFHAHGLLTSINTLIMGGASIVFQSRFDTSAVLRELPAITVVMAVPTHYARLLNDPRFDAGAFSNVRLATCGSAPLPMSLAKAFHAVTGRHLIERYGSTEAAIITAIPLSQSARMGWVGWPLPGVEIRVRCEDGSVAARSAVGTLETRGENVFLGYWRMQTEQADAFTSDGWFRTGDIAEIDADGCVRLLGRAKDLIISGGLNIYPVEIENAVLSLPGVMQSAVFGVPHPDFGEACVGVVKVNPDQAFDERSAREALRKKLASFKIPKRLIPIAEIPHNEAGKVLKQALRDQYQCIFSNVES